MWNTRRLKYFLTPPRTLLHLFPSRAAAPGWVWALAGRGPMPGGPMPPPAGSKGLNISARKAWTNMKRLRIWKVLLRPRGSTTMLRRTGRPMEKRLAPAVTTPLARPRRRRK
uniref:Uncharacterized protein n=1 Tax=Gasterosteus aculeatus TaxID=69293 RepID=G3Q0F5_GASAC